MFRRLLQPVALSIQQADAADEALSLDELISEALTLDELMATADSVAAAASTASKRKKQKHQGSQKAEAQVDTSHKSPLGTFLPAPK